MLAIDYSSSDEDTDHSKAVINSSEAVDEKVVNNSKTGSIINPFDANNYDLSSSDDDFEDNEHKKEIKVSEVIKTSGVKRESHEKQIGSDIQNSSQSKVSIFSNPFKEEETKELSQLERHVKLSDNKTMTGNSDEKRCQTICWSYHKHKRCRFGNRCRYRHNDTDFIDTKAIKRNDNSGKRRVGITDSLIPPKRAIKAFYSQQNI